MRNKKGQFVKENKHTKDIKEKIREALSGKKHSEETKKKMSIIKKGKTPKFIPNNRGRKRTEEFKRKVSNGKRGQKPWNTGIKTGIIPSTAFKKGKEHYNWQGGKSFEPYSIDWTETLKRSIRERDNYVCQLCSQYGNAVHHIDYDKKNCNPDNLINLCKKCNSKVNKNRNYWTNYFQNLMNKKNES